MRRPSFLACVKSAAVPAAFGCGVGLALNLALGMEPARMFLIFGGSFLGVALGFGFLIWKIA